MGGKLETYFWNSFIKNLKQCLKQLGVEMNIKVCPKLQKSLRLTDFGDISYKM